MRVALGARRESVLSIVLADGAGLATVGTVIGLGLAFLAARWWRTLLFGITPLDPMLVLRDHSGTGTAAKYPIPPGLEPRGRCGPCRDAWESHARPCEARMRNNVTRECHVAVLAGICQVRTRIRP